MLISILFILLRSIIWVFSSILSYFLLSLIVTILFRVFKINMSRRWQRNIKPNECILITGASSGIGLALAKHFYSIGYSVVAAYYDAREPGYMDLKKLGSTGLKTNKLLLVELDVTNQKSIKVAHEKCRSLFSEHNLTLYGLINNAGLGSLQPYAWLQRKTIKGLIDTNLLGSMMVTREFLPILIKSKGRIINVSSGLGFVPGETYVSYGVTKCAQIYFTRGLNLELDNDSFGVKSVAVVPHNFIKNTNICASNSENNHKAWQELSNEEQVLYKDKFDQHSKRVEALETSTRELRENSSRARQTSKVSSVNKNSFKDKPARAIKEVLAALKGENQSKSIEESGALQGFEDALRLKHPPEIIFAGDSSYSLLVGSLLLVLPSGCATLLSDSVAPSLYR